MTLELSIATDYITDIGNPEPYLQKISKAGFTHVLWCHEFNTDHLYSDTEIDEISGWLNEYDLKILDLHASEGKEKYWLSSEAHKRKLGLELVKNRIDMANELSCDTIMLHFGHESDISHNKSYWSRLCSSLNELEPYAREQGVKIALENPKFHIDYDEIIKTFSEYQPDFLGFCYDSGHGNIEHDLPLLEALADRLISVHLNDNNGIASQHKLPFSGTVKWEELAGILARSSYNKCISMEVIMTNHPEITEEELFLSEAYQTGEKFTKMVQEHVNSSHLR